MCVRWSGKALVRACNHECVTAAQTKPRLDWVDAAKAISIVLVVLTHAQVELAFIGVRTMWSDVAIDIFATLRMPLFFAASGLFATKWLRASWGRLAQGKLAILVWVFLIWQPAVFTYKLAETLWLPNQPDNSIADQVVKAAISPLRPNGELWFLWALALFFVLARATSRLPVWVRVGVPALVSLLWMSFTWALPENIERALGAGWLGFPAYYVFFIAAATFSPALLTWFGNIRFPMIAALIGAWIAGTVLVKWLGFDGFGARFALSVLGVAAGFSFARLLERISVVLWLGRNTLPIYVAHIAFIVGIVVAVYRLGLTSALVTIAPIAPALLTVAAILATVVLYLSLRRTRIGRYAYEAPAWFLRGKDRAGHPGNARRAGSGQSPRRCIRTHRSLSRPS